MNHVDTPGQLPTALSFCPGILGLERGIERVIGPIRTLAYAEIEAFLVANLLAGMQARILAPAPIWSNVKTFPWELFRGKVDILMGGYPCQPFSNAGLGLAEADPRHLWPYFEGGIRTVRPVCCWLENVAAHLNKGYREVKRSLEEMGYIVKEGIYAAEEVGAPHLRERLFILAILGNADGAEWRTRIAGRIRRQQERLYEDRKEVSSGFECAGEELADADGNGTGTVAGHFGRESEEDEGKIQREEWNGLFGQRGRRHVGDGRAEGVGAKLAYATRSGQSPIWNDGKSDETSDYRTFNSGTVDRWPSRPGQGQFDWEAPRTIESGMGCTIDGYNFREDLLRALGNSVVEQQAEYAFRDLMRKHGF